MRITRAQSQATPGGIVAPPATFGWSPPFNVRRTPEGFTTNFNPDLYRIGGKRYYVAPGGTGNGSSAASPLPDPKSAIDAINAASETSAVVVLAPGTYANAGWATRRANCHLSVICPDGQALITNGVPLTWTLHAGTTWKATKASGSPLAATRTYDLSQDDGYGFGARLAQAASTAECETTSGSAYYDGGTQTLYVNLADGREPDADLYAAVNVEAGGHSAEGTNLYVENVTFYGGRDAFRVVISDGQSAVFKNCGFHYADHGYSGFSSAGGGFLALLDCSSAATGRDGFNYAGTTRVLEVDCVGRSNGDDANGNNNATTAHDDTRIVRVNGDYRGTQNRTLHDVHRSRSWNLACYVGAPTDLAAADPFSVGAGYESHGASERASHVWLDDCSVEGAGYVATGCGLYVRDTAIPSMVLGEAEAY